MFFFDGPGQHDYVASTLRNECKARLVALISVSL